jgi:hypothetical protein
MALNFDPPFVVPLYAQDNGIVAFFEMIYLPVLNLLAVFGLDEAYSWERLEVKEIAVGIILMKWIHTWISGLIRLWVANTDLTYTGDIFGAISVKTVMDMAIEMGPIGKLINSFFFIPLLYQGHHSEDLYDFLPSLIYFIFDPVFSFIGLDIGFDIFQFGTSLVGYLGAV